MSIYYLIDFENVREMGISTLPPTDSTDHIYVFYTDNAAKLNMDAMLNHEAELKFIKVAAGKQSLDMHLVSVLGFMLRDRGQENEYIVVSRDNGFDNVINFWKSKGFLVGRHLANIPNPEPEERTEKPEEKRKNNRSRKNGSGKKNNSRRKEPLNVPAAEEVPETPVFVEPAAAEAEVPEEAVTEVIEAVVKEAAMEGAEEAAAVEETSPEAAAEAVEETPEEVVEETVEEAAAEILKEETAAPEENQAEEETSEDTSETTAEAEDSAITEAAAEVKAEDTAEKETTETEVLPEPEKEKEAKEAAPAKKKRSSRSRKTKKNAVPAEKAEEISTLDAAEEIIPTPTEIVKETVQTEEKAEDSFAESENPEEAEKEIRKEVDPHTLMNNKLMSLLRGKLDANTLGAIASIVIRNMDVKNYKQVIYRAMVKKFGQKSGLEYYSMIKKDI